MLKEKYAIKKEQEILKTNYSLIWNSINQYIIIFSKNINWIFYIIIYLINWNYIIINKFLTLFNI